MSGIQQSVLLSKIYLDNENPRHEPLATEADIIRFLLQKDDVRQLGKNIVDLGGTSPLELVGLFPHSTAKGFFSVAEGNRRICALKLLVDPDKADSEKNRAYFAALRDRLEEPIKSINAVVFEDRMEPSPWVSLRHAGQQGGVGTKPWDSQQKERHDRTVTGKANPNTQASLMLDYARLHKLLPVQQLDKVKLTTLTRFLSNPVMRDVMGLKDHKTMNVSVPMAEFNAILTRFLTDSITDDSDVGSRTNADERRKYANKLRSEGVAPVTRDQPVIDLAEVVPGKKVKPGSAAPARNNPNRDKAKYVIPSDFKMTIKNPVLRRLVDELRALPAEEFSFAGAYLLRAVIEQATTLFVKKNGIAPPALLHLKLMKMADLLETQGLTNRELKTLRTMGSEENSRSSPDTIGHYVHGGAVPTKTDLIGTWDSIEPVLKVAISKL